MAGAAWGGHLVDVKGIKSGASGAEAGAWVGRAGGAGERARGVVARAHQANGADQRGAARAARLRAGVAGRGEGCVDNVDGVVAELLSDDLRIRSGLLADRGGLATRDGLRDEMTRRADGHVELREEGVAHPHLERRVAGACLGPAVRRPAGKERPGRCTRQPEPRLDPAADAEAIDRPGGAGEEDADAGVGRAPLIGSRAALGAVGSPQRRWVRHLQRGGARRDARRERAGRAAAAGERRA